MDTQYHDLGYAYEYGGDCAISYSPPAAYMVSGVNPAFLLGAGLLPSRECLFLTQHTMQGKARG